ncbi:MAG TPA: ribonuclease HI [Desulfobacterales bacterium]|nr:ribonuclease HI [Desulfobacterales bacterium]
MAKKKYYAVAVGRETGIFDNWPLAAAQVKGCPGARFKGFLTRREAEAWLKNPQYTTGAVKSAKRKRPPETKIKALKNHAGLVIYTDGGSINNPGPGGYGAVIIDYDLEPAGRREISGGYRLTTNNRMELMACIAALRSLGDSERPIALYSDSSYVVNAINKGWARKWQRNGWLKSDKKPALNADLWEELLNLTAGLTITFNWVKGHAGNPLNERCDQLAVQNARQNNLPVDRGYEERN